MSGSFLNWAAYWTGIATVGFTALAAVFGVFAWYFSLKASDVKDEQLSKFQTESKVAIANANADAAKANEEAAKARLELEQIKAKHADRIITDEQRTVFMEAIKSTSKHGAKITCTRHSQEVVAYSEDIAKLLTDSGFTVTNDRGAILQGLNGLIVTVNNPDSSCAKNILNAFNSIGIKAQGKVMPGIPDCDISVMVGYKPLEAIAGDASIGNALSEETK
jgi:hypothetical protein